MKKEDKKAIVAELTDKFSAANFFYIADSSSLSVEKVNDFRRMCFNKDVEMRVVKNSLVKKALESINDDSRYDSIYGALKGQTALLFSDTANAPGKILEEFRKKNDKPVLKAAYIDASVYIGDDAIKELAALKSREELIGDVIMLLQSPAKNVISALSSSGQTISGLLKTLADRPES